MQLIVEVLNITTGGSRIALLSEQSANLLGVHSSDRIKMNYRNREMIAIANIAANFPQNRIGLYEETANALGVREDETVNVDLAPLPESLFNIRAKLRGERLREKDIMAIVKDTHRNGTPLVSDLPEADPQTASIPPDYCDLIHVVREVSLDGTTLDSQLACYRGEVSAEVEGSENYGLDYASTFRCLDDEVVGYQGPWEPNCVEDISRRSKDRYVYC